MRFSQVYPRNYFGRPDQLTNHLFGTNSWKEVVHLYNYITKPEESRQLGRIGSDQLPLLAQVLVVHHARQSLSLTRGTFR